MNIHRRVAALLILLLTPLCLHAAPDSPRERLSINTGWRFHQGDPPGMATVLDYDVRPEVARNEDGKDADAKPEEAAKVTARSEAVLKPWILPTGNAFIKDKTRRHSRPDGDPAAGVTAAASHSTAYAQPSEGTAMKTTRLILFAALAALPLVLRAQDVSMQSTSIQSTPIAAGQPKFLGGAYSPLQAKDFAAYWNKVTPENAGKWGVVEPERDRMEWSGLDEAYRFAKANGFPFQMHVMVWGNQQPEWMEKLPRDEQREEIEEWFAAVAERYPDLDFVEVVNEPLNDPPSKDDEGGGNYIEALGGAGASGWDWILESFRLARKHFPRSTLMINDYSITNNAEAARRYRQIIELLQKEKLVDAIGVQGHAFATTTEVPMSVHRANLDSLAATGLPIYVTELDIDGPTDEQQLHDYQRIFPVFWEHPGVHGITLWGFRHGLWREKEGAYLVRKDGSERPALEWLRKYVHGGAESATESPSTQAR